MDAIVYWGIGIVVLEAAVIAATAWIVHRREEQRLGEYQDKILRTQREEVQSIYQTMRGWRHDYHNHMQKLKAHLALGQVGEAREYLDCLEKDLDSIDIAIRTGNVSVDAIISSKISVAKKKDIRVNLKAVVPEKLTVTDVDLCAIIGNLIDNAVDACEKVKEKERRFLRVYIGVYKKQLYLSVTNATAEKRRRWNTFFPSDKRGNHGHGLRRIDFLVGRYDGYVNRKNEPGVFATEILLPL